MDEMTEGRRLLRELFDLVNGECPSILNEDSGGDGRLYVDIEDFLSRTPARSRQGEVLLVACPACGGTGGASSGYGGDGDRCDGGCEPLYVTAARKEGR